MELEIFVSLEICDSPEISLALECHWPSIRTSLRKPRMPLALALALISGSMLSSQPLSLGTSRDSPNNYLGVGTMQHVKCATFGTCSYGFMCVLFMDCL